MTTVATLVAAINAHPARSRKAVTASTLKNKAEYERLLAELDAIPAGVTPSDFAKAHGLDGKIVRKALRSLFPTHERGKRWSLTDADLAALRSALKLLDESSDVGAPSD